MASEKEHGAKGSQVGAEAEKDEAVEIDQSLFKGFEYSNVTLFLSDLKLALKDADALIDKKSDAYCMITHHAEAIELRGGEVPNFFLDMAGDYASVLKDGVSKFPKDRDGFNTFLNEKFLEIEEKYTPDMARRVEEKAAERRLRTAVRTSDHTVYNRGVLWEAVDQAVAVVFKGSGEGVAYTYNVVAHAVESMNEAVKKEPAHEKKALAGLEAFQESIREDAKALFAEKEKEQPTSHADKEMQKRIEANRGRSHTV